MSTHVNRRPAGLWQRSLLIWALLGSALIVGPIGSQGPISAASLVRGDQPLSLLWNVPEQQYTYGLAWGDINNDGDLDLIFGNSSQPSQIYRNCAVAASSDRCAAGAPFVRDGQWQPALADTRSVAIGDLNGDGQLDLLLGNNQQASQVYLNTGAGGFALAPWAPAAARTTSVAIGDLNGDGSLDLLLGNDRQASRVYLNDGAGGFALAPWTPAAARTTSVAIGDLNGDGSLDLLLGNDQQASRVYLNTGAGTFALAPTPLPGNDFPFAPSVAVGDLNGDGSLDLLIGNRGDDEADPDTGGVSQVYLNTGAGTFTIAAWDAPAAKTTSVAIGDLDNDGRPDLILGNNGQASQLYRNTAGTAAPVFVRDTSWAPPTSLNTSSVAIGDSNGDGSLDLAIGNNGAFSQIYRGDQPALPARNLRDELTDKATSLALADVDNNGSLDLLLGNRDAPSQLYLNDGAGAFTLNTARFNPAAAPTEAVAWADVNNDGSLDLLLGNNGAASQLYMNDGAGTLTLNTARFSPAAADTKAVAWADVNNDGWLDLVLGNESQPSQLYMNDGGGRLVFDPTWRPESDPTASLAWGDINNDGDLDLVVGNGSDKPSRLYRNCTYPDRGVACPAGVRLALDPSWNPLRADTTSLALGDLNGDGSLDLVVGNNSNPTQIYLNDGGGTLTIDPGWQPAPSAASSVALGDMDGDQDLDLLVGNKGQASQVYRNDGGGAFTLLSASASLGSDGNGKFANTVAAVWGDLNSDGRLDLALANSTIRPSQIVINGGDRSAVAAARGPQPSGPTISIRQPATPAGPLLATGKILSSTVISLSYTLRDNESDPVAAIAGFYSLDGGGTWQPAAPSGATQTRNLATAPGAGRTYNFGWDTFDSCFFGQSDTVLFQLRALPMPLRTSELRPGCSSLPASPSAAPGSARYAGQVAGSVQRPFVGASTQLFRARGTQVQVLNGGAPVAGATVYRLTAGDERAAPMASSDGAPFTTDSNGYLSGRGALAATDRIAALAPVTGLRGLLAANAAVRFFYTSPITIGSGAPEAQVKKNTAGRPSTQLLSVSSGRPLVLLDLKVGVEWDASNDEVFQRQLSSDLQRASELLYDWTDGQVALGRLDVSYGRAALNQANIRIFSTNRLRPGATQGGILSTALADPTAAGVRYKPGYVDIGAVWTRYGDSAGLGEDWPRALAHEIGHYALFLDDNYIGRDAAKRLISIPPKATGSECRGAMSNPYRDDYSEFQPGGAEWDTLCKDTLSNYETRRADWKTIVAFYNSLGQGFRLNEPGAFGQNAGPSAQVLGLTSVVLPGPIGAGTPAPISAPIFSLVRADSSRYSADAGARVQAIRFTDNDSTAIDLGRPTADQLNARGATAGDSICVYDQADGGWRTGCTSVTSSLSPIRIASAPNWQPRITITPIDTANVQVTIAANGVVTAGQPAPTLSLKLFADAPASDKTSVDVTLAPNSSAYSYTFRLSRPIYGGLLRVRVKGDTASAGRREVVSEYLLSSGLPAATAGLQQTRPCTTCAPLASSGDGQMLIYGDALGAGQFYSFQAATTVASAPPWGIFVGQIYRLYTNIPANTLKTKNLYLTTAYLESELPAGSEGGLAIYFSADGNAWERLEQSRFDPSRNEISSAVVGSGYYALVSRLEVADGWNSIAYPWAEPLSVLAASERLNIRPRTNFSTIHAYVQADKNDRWKVYDVDAPWWVNDLSSLEYGKGYWFIVPAGGGTPSVYTPARTAEGVPVPPATYYGALPLGAAKAAAGLEVRATSGSTVCATATTERKAVDPARPSGATQVVFLIQVQPAGQGAPAGCGIQGQPITITVGGATVGRSAWDNTRPITFRNFYLPLVFGPAAPALAGGAAGPGDNPPARATEQPWTGQPLP